MGLTTNGRISGYGTFRGTLGSTSDPGSVRVPENDVYYDLEYLGLLLQGSGQLFGTFSGGTLLTSAILSGSGALDATWVKHYVMNTAQAFTGIGDLDAFFYKILRRLNWVGWSKIGEARIHIDESNEAGYMPLPIKGVIKRVMSLGDNCVAYGDNGVNLLIPVSSPVVTYGQQFVSNVGLIYEGALAGTDLVHYYIGTDRNLYVFEAGSRPKLLHFQEHIEEILGEYDTQVLLHYDPIELLLYISTSQGGLILSQKGLGGGYGNLTAVAKDYLDTFFISPSTIATPLLDVETDLLDLDIRGLKTIRWLDIQGVIPPELQVRVGYRYDNSSSLSYTPWQFINTEGSAFIGITCLELVLCFKIDVAEIPVLIDNVGIKFAVSDKRFLRGMTKYDRRYDV